MTRYVILLHRSSILPVAFFSMQNVIKMPTEGFFQREAVGKPSSDFSDEKFMFKRTWQVVFWGARNDSGAPKQLAARLKARDGLHFKVVTLESRKRGTKKREKERCNVQICFQEIGTAKNMNAIYPCFQSIVNRICSSFGIVSWDLFSATILPVHGVRCKFAGL